MVYLFNYMATAIMALMTYFHNLTTSVLDTIIITAYTTKTLSATASATPTILSLTTSLLTTLTATTIHTTPAPSSLSPALVLAIDDAASTRPPLVFIYTTQELLTYVLTGFVLFGIFTTAYIVLRAVIRGVVGVVRAKFTDEKVVVAAAGSTEMESALMAMKWELEVLRGEVRALRGGLKGKGEFGGEEDRVEEAGGEEEEPESDGAEAKKDA